MNLLQAKALSDLLNGTISGPDGNGWYSVRAVRPDGRHVEFGFDGAIVYRHPSVMPDRDPVDYSDVVMWDDWDGSGKWAKAFAEAFGGHVVVMGGEHLVCLTRQDGRPVTVGMESGCTWTGPQEHHEWGMIENLSGTRRPEPEPMNRMTFDQFRATGRDEADLGAYLRDSDLDGCLGRIYLEALYIRDVSDLAGGGPRWGTLIGRDYWRTDDLESLERRLYQFAMDERMTETEVA